MSHHNTAVLILGGGPAGGAAALELAQAGCDVVLLERQAVPGWKIGETLPPEARVHLQRLDHWETFRQSGHLPCHGIVSCWGSSVPVEKDFLLSPYGHGWQLDRATFERELLQAAADAGCRVCYGTESRSISRSSGQWCIETQTNLFRSEWLLDCTGRNSVLGPRIGGEFEQLEDYVSLFCILDAATTNDKDARTYVEAYEDGWAYSALMPNSSRIVAFLTDRELVPSASDLASWLEARVSSDGPIGRLLKERGYPTIEEVHLVNATSGRYNQFINNRAMLVGDAGMTFDPLSGWGSAKAMVSAASAVRAILGGTDFQGACEELWNDYLVKYRDFYLAERRWADSPFWSRRHQLVLA